MPEEATPRRTRNHDSNDGTPGGLPADDVPSTTDSQLLSDALDAKSPTDVELDDDDEHHDYHKLNDGTSYEEMVAAKRKRNLEHLKSTGLLTAAASLRNAVKGATARKNGISANNNIRKKEVRIPPATMRKSKRLAGEKADGRYVDDDRGGKFKFGIDHEDDGRTVSTPTNENSAVELPNAAALQVPWHTHEFSNRVNDGSDLTITAAIGLCDDKWIDTDSLNRAAHFVERGLRSLRVDESTKGESGEGIPIAVTPPLSTTKISTSSNADYSDDFIFRVNNSAKKISDQLSSLRVDDNNAVAKVTPDRIYSVECHPSTDALVVCAGDKQGYIGIWNVDKFHEISGNGDNIANGGVHLFKVHNRPISNLQWTNNGSSLFSFSYDSSVRMFDIHKQVFTEVFATYDDSPKFKDKSGYGLHENRVGYWVQFGCVDLRNEKCLFLSTSTGVLMHVDLRAGDHEKHAVTFQQHLSEKKINTVR